MKNRVLRTVTMLRSTTLWEIDAGDTVCAMRKVRKTQHERESRAVDRIYSLLPGIRRRKNCGISGKEFERVRGRGQPICTSTMDNIQPAMLNAANGGVMERNGEFNESGLEEAWNPGMQRGFTETVGLCV